MEQLVKQDDHKTGQDELNDQKEANASTEIARLAVKASQDENAGLTEGEDDGEELLGGLVQLAVGLQIEIDVNEVSTGKKLEDVLATISCDSRVLSNLLGRPCQTR